MTLFVRRVLMVAFPNGTKDLAGVRKIVARFQDDVTYWEPRNEPNGGSSGADFAVKEMKPFYDTVKGVNPKLKVMGPGTVGVAPPGNMLGWIEDFLKAGGGRSIDAFSFHAYNTVNGDVEMARTALDTLQTLLARYGLGGVEKWQTEQGYFAAVYGSYQPQTSRPVDDGPDDGLRAARHPQGTQPLLVRHESRLLGHADVVGERRPEHKPRRLPAAGLVGRTLRN